MNNAENISNINGANAKAHKQFNFDFMGKSRIFAIVVAVIFVTGMVSFFVQGFNLDIDFVGGTVMQYHIGVTVDNSVENDVRAIVEEIVPGRVSSVIMAGADKNEVMIKTLDINTEQREAILSALLEKYDINTDLSSVNNVNPVVGKELTRNTLWSIGIAVALMLLYVIFRFDIISGLSTILTQMFDMFVMLTFYSLFQIPMSTAVIAAFLTILGYSINATIIVFDRVRENKKLMGTKQPYAVICNTSINQTLLRSLNTTLTSTITLVMVYIFGVASIRDFVLPLMVGIASGLFSSTCLAGALSNFIKAMSDKRKTAKKSA